MLTFQKVNSCLKLAYFPRRWKLSKVVPILKPNKCSNLATSYRPISLLPTLSKVFEQTILTRLQIHIDAHQILPDIQFGFRSRHSTIHQLARITEDVTKHFAWNMKTMMLSLDIEKAFDSVWHDNLITKLHAIQLPLYLLKTLQSYLTNRQFYVTIDSTNSEVHDIPAGVPQGSLLSPILFNIYTSDLPELPPGVKMGLYADDAAIWTSGRRINSLTTKIIDSLNILNNYYKKNRIKINETKTSAIVFSKGRLLDNVRLQTANATIKTENTIKYLGVLLDRKLDFNQHIQDKIKKANAARWHTRPLIHTQIDNKIKLNLYKTCIRPILTYASQIWCTANKTNFRKLQILQNKIIRECTHAPRRTRITSLHLDNDMQTLEQFITLLTTKFIDNLPFHDNPLINQLTQKITTRTRRGLRLKLPAQTIFYNPT